MSEIPIESYIVSGLIVIAWLFNAVVLTQRVPMRAELSRQQLKTSDMLGRGLILPMKYPNFLLLAKNIFGLFGFNQRLVILFNKKTDRG
jgi:hypothetical protein